MRFIRKIFIHLIISAILTGCQSLPPMGSVSDYSSYDCNRLAQEVDAINQHETAHREASSFGFTDFLLAVGGGVAAGRAQNKGNYAGSQQIMDNARRSDEQKQAFRNTADSLSTRSSLLIRLRQAKGCY